MMNSNHLILCKQIKPCLSKTLFTKCSSRNLWLNIYIYIYIYIQNLALNDLWRLIGHKTRTTKQKSSVWLDPQDALSLDRTRLILCQSDILPLVVSKGIFYAYIFTYTLLATWSAQFLRIGIAFQRMWQQANFPTREFNWRVREANILPSINRLFYCFGFLFF